MGARHFDVLDSPDDIIPDRPKKPVRGRAARIAAYRAQRQEEAASAATRPRKVAVEGTVQREPAPAEPGPIVWAKPTVYDVIPYCLDQPRR